MRALILVLFVLGIAAHAHSAKAGLSEIHREISAPADVAISTDEATQQSENRIGLSKTKRRDVQRRLTRLGFDTKASGKFDEPTRDAIARWQEQHGYPNSGFLNTAQLQALLNESSDAAEDGKSGHPDRRRSRVRHARGVGGPIGAIGHVVGGLFGR